MKMIERKICYVTEKNNNFNWLFKKYFKVRFTVQHIKSSIARWKIILLAFNDEGLGIISSRKIRGLFRN